MKAGSLETSESTAQLRSRSYNVTETRKNRIISHRLVFCDAGNAPFFRGLKLKET